MTRRALLGFDQPVHPLRRQLHWSGAVARMTGVLHNFDHRVATLPAA